MKVATVVWLNIFVCISATNPVYHFLFFWGDSAVIEEILSPQYSGQKINSYDTYYIQFWIDKTS